ncbi:hypothetical protein KP509_20G005400 [Ceratopteris richardii]|uniref:Uncharacterized protein n=1 Tax=Ceratopteris richardii TaxID=49495 RepID=A0A8T2SGE6_CERRI|nr:hypothetical protein KP509_20G005400 [Ceratopteris richardii]
MLRFLTSHELADSKNRSSSSYGARSTTQKFGTSMPASKSESSSSCSSGSTSSPLQTCTVSIADSKHHLSSSVHESLHVCFDALSPFHTCTMSPAHASQPCLVLYAQEPLVSSSILFIPIQHRMVTAF